MIEMPEAHVLSAQFNRLIKGKKITDVFANYTPHRFAMYNEAPEKYQAILVGKTIGETHARGGMIEISAGDCFIVLSDGANIRCLPPNAELPSKHQLLVGFDDHSCIVLSIRMYGVIWVIKNGTAGPSYYETAKSKPSVFSDAFSKEYFTALIGDENLQNKSVKAAIATEQRIPGLGNGVLQDILYNAGIHPKQKVSKLTPNDIERLFYSIKNTLSDMLSGGGRNSEKDLLGNPGNYIPLLATNTTGTLCPKCGGIIQKENYLGGAIYYCDGCQSL